MAYKRRYLFGVGLPSYFQWCQENNKLFSAQGWLQLYTLKKGYNIANLVELVDGLFNDVSPNINAREKNNLSLAFDPTREYASIEREKPCHRGENQFIIRSMRSIHRL